MKKLLFIILALVIASTMIFAGCGGEEKTTTTTAAPTTTAAGGPVYGGTLRIIYNAAPAVLGGSVEQGPFDLFVLLGGVEKIMEYDDNQVLAPRLAESVKVDEAAKTITVKLRAGIKCHDGSDFDAAAMVWNYETQVANKRIGYLNQWGSIEAVDKTTAVIHYTGGYNNQLVMGWLWSPPMWSKGAHDKFATEDEFIQWARGNFSSTGPFKLLEYQRDVKLVLERFDDYWGPKPYLDKVEFIFIPESVTASSMMQAGEADLWLSGPVNDQLHLETLGLVRQSGLGAIPCIYPNTVAAESKWKDTRLLNALEYALDKPTIAKALGQGQYTALKMLSTPGRMGYDEAYTGHPYDVAKAKELLAEAGYPNGFNIKLTALVGSEDTCTALKQYWDAVGIITDIDIADAGRYYGGLYGMGWDDLLLVGYGEGDMLANFHSNLGDQPLTKMAASSYALPPELLEMSMESRTYSSIADQEAIMKKITRYIADNDFIIPLWVVPGSFVRQTWLHIDYLQQGGFSFYFERYWLEPKK